MYIGTVDKGVVEVTNCFCVPHKEHADQVEAELNYAMDVYELNRRVHAAEGVVGWWATGRDVTSHSSVIHEYYARECRSPVHLTLDTALSGAHMGLRAYVGAALGVPRGRCGAMFSPVTVHVAGAGPAAAALALCRSTEGGGRARAVRPPAELAQVSAAAARLSELLDAALRYVSDVRAGRTAPNNAAGRDMLKLLHAVPHLPPEVFANAFASGVKDLLMVHLFYCPPL